MDNFRKKMDEFLEQQRAIINLRQEYNLKILDILREEVYTYPKIRLCQLLNVFINKFNEESIKTYNDIVKLRKERKD